MISIDDLARECGVSKATVSRAFKEQSPISAATRKLILQKAEELGYKPKEYKPQSIANNSRIIGIMLGMGAYPYANDICSAISDSLEKTGYVPIVMNNQNGETTEIKTLNAVKDILSGLIIVPSSTQNEYNAKFISQLSKKFPVISLVRRIPELNKLDSITIQNYSGLLNATRLLLDHGHKNIGFFAGPMNITPSHDKLTGYTDALNRYNVPVNGDYICYGVHDIKKTAVQTRELLNKHPEITALITSNITMSRGVLLGIEQMHLSVPENISLVSYGNDTIFSVGKNKITCIYDYHYNLGVQASNLILRRIKEFKVNKKYEPEHTVIHPELIIRGSEVFPTKPIASLNGVFPKEKA